jgi:hypothetical protein
MLDDLLYFCLMIKAAVEEGAVMEVRICFTKYFHEDICYFDQHVFKGDRGGYGGDRGGRGGGFGGGRGGFGGIIIFFSM